MSPEVWIRGISVSKNGHVSTKKLEKKERKELILVFNGYFFKETRNSDNATITVFVQVVLLGMISRVFQQLNFPCGIPHRFAVPAAHTCKVALYCSEEATSYRLLLMGLIVRQGDGISEGLRSLLWVEEGYSGGSYWLVVINPRVCRRQEIAASLKESAYSFIWRFWTQMFKRWKNRPFR